MRKCASFKTSTWTHVLCVAYLNLVLGESLFQSKTVLPDRFLLNIESRRSISELLVTPDLKILKPYTSTKTSLLLLVKGSLSNFQKRQNLRNYYNNQNLLHLNPDEKILLNSFQIDIKFIVGHSSDPLKVQFNRKILEESFKFNDIIVGNFEDVYENLVFKSLSGLEWYNNLEKRFRADYVMLIDDDVEVKLPDLLNLLKSKSRKQYSRNKSLQQNESFSFTRNSKSRNDFLKEIMASRTEPKNVVKQQDPLILCPWKNARNARVSRRGPWAVSVTSYPSSHWPSYCGGACYLMNFEAVNKLYESARNVVELDVPIEDAFITGILRERANLQLESTRPLCIHNYEKNSVTGKFLTQRDQNKNDEFTKI